MMQPMARGKNETLAHFKLRMRRAGLARAAALTAEERRALAQKGGLANVANAEAKLTPEEMSRRMKAMVAIRWAKAAQQEGAA